jgi:asparagine synthase (glutamine-hydrolysing)
MCGIAGFLGGSSGIWSGETARILQRMADAIAHRGPDGEGYWSDPQQRVAFAHRRLAILDLSPTGAQPMESASGRFVISFNGEIYNHRSLRGRLTSSWRGTSDTETLLAGFDEWGIRATVEEAVGMFAFAVWDRATCALTLARDRLGEKPLYYGWQRAAATANDATFLFASDLSALRAHPAFEAQISRDALRGFMRRNNVGGADSIYSGISKLPAGCMLTLSRAAPHSAPHRYWTGADIVRQGIGNPFTGDAETAIDEVEQLLRASVSQQMVADVPVGVFLSGGVDSSLITALMQVQAPRAIRTFSIGFDEHEFNEARHARAVAKHLRTEHTELYVTGRDALDVVPKIASIYAEPFADSSQIPTFLLSKLTRSYVTVALSGDGGDELFGGYNRYQICNSLWRRLSHIPLSIRRGIAAALLRGSPEFWDNAARRLGSIVPLSRRFARIGEKVRKGARALTSASGDELHLQLMSHWDDPDKVVIGGAERDSVPSTTASELRELSDVEKMMALDMLGYMCDDILTKVDRAAMAASLETRVPMLDHRVVEFAWRLPLKYKLRGGQTKWVLRQVLYRHVPAGLIERPKMGFAVPIDSWLRGPLRDWAEDLLSGARLLREGIFHAAPIRQMWTEHLSGIRDWQRELWCVLMFQEWRLKTHG